MVKWKQELGGKEEGQWGVKGKSEVHGRVTEVLMIENVKKTYLPLSLSLAHTKTSGKKKSEVSNQPACCVKSIHSLCIV